MGIQSYGGYGYGTPHDHHQWCPHDGLCLYHYRGGPGMARQLCALSHQPGLLVQLFQLTWDAQRDGLPRHDPGGDQLLLQQQRLSGPGPALVWNLEHGHRSIGLFGGQPDRVRLEWIHWTTADAGRQRSDILAVGGLGLRQQPCGFVRPLQRALSHYLGHPQGWRKHRKLHDARAPGHRQRRAQRRGQQYLCHRRAGLCL